MLFLRTTQPVYAITFDLDDTLYDNAPIIKKTNKISSIYLQNSHPILKNIGIKDWYNELINVKTKEPNIYHDVTKWRKKSLINIIYKSGLSYIKSKELAKAVMSVFLYWRSRIKIKQKIIRLLSELHNYYPMGIISNGNAIPEIIGLKEFFKFSLRAGKHGRAKPYSDMFKLAAQKLQLSPNRILHVGDDLYADVAGAICAGMQPCWVRPVKKKINFKKTNINTLSTIFEIDDLSSLMELIPS